MIKLPENLLSKIKNPKALIVLGLAGILLIFISSFFPSGEEEKQYTEPQEITAEEYKAAIESDIEKMVADITGSKKVSVVVTLESGLRYSYADEREETSSDKTESDTKSTESELKESYITVKTDSGGEEALLLTTEMPEIRGVAVVCVGGDDELLKEKIENAVTAALNITSKRVYICGRN